ncbi:MAG: DNA repair protein RadC [Desulfomonilia bacterium]|jgi:DNA repair protein RadC
MSKQSSHSDGHRSRLRTRFLSAGREALSDYELLELLLGYAIPRRDTKPLAKELLKEYGSLRRIFDEPAGELMDRKGLGEYSVALIRLVKACMSRCLEPVGESAPVLDSPEAVLRYVRAEIGGEKSEHFLLLCLNAAGRLIHLERLCRGTVNMAHVYPREVFRTALARGASALILIHNHPSGTLSPSVHDERLTRALTELGEGLGIPVHDHIIVTRDQAYSIRLGRPIDT